MVKKIKKTRKFKEIKGNLTEDCDECGERRKLRFYDKEGNYICKSCKVRICC